MEIPYGISDQGELLYREQDYMVGPKTAEERNILMEHEENPAELTALLREADYLDSLLEQ